MKRTILTAALLSAALLSGCSAGPPAGGGSYESATEVKDALVNAGGTCDNWAAGNKVLKAKSSGTCGTGYAIMVFDDPSALTDWRSMIKSMGFNGLSGKNWAISGKIPEEAQKKLGGDVIAGKS